MTLEIENIFRAVRDIRQAILSLEGRGLTAAQAEKKSEMEELANQMEFKARDVEFEMKKAEPRIDTNEHEF